MVVGRATVHMLQDTQKRLQCYSCKLTRTKNSSSREVPSPGRIAANFPDDGRLWVRRSVSAVKQLPQSRAQQTGAAIVLQKDNSRSFLIHAAALHQVPTCLAMFMC